MSFAADSSKAVAEPPHSKKEARLVSRVLNSLCGQFLTRLYF